MRSVDFPDSNCYFGPPPGMEESQCRSIHAYRGEVASGSCEGAGIVVTAWMPDAQDLARLNAGHPIFLTFIGGLPPHMATTDIQEATNPA